MLKFTSYTFTIIVILFCSGFFISYVHANKHPVITKVKLTQNEKFSKIEIRLTEPVQSLPVLMAALQNVSFELEAFLPERKLKRIKNEKIVNDEFSITSEKDFVNKVQLIPFSQGTRFEIKRNYFTPVNFIQQESPPALIVEFPREYFQKESKELKKGITKHFIRTVGNRGPVSFHVLEIDLSNKNISFKVGMPDLNKLKKKLTLKQIVEKEKAYAGINANYFDVKEGNPLGTLITDGTWVTGPVYDRVAIGFSKDNMVFIDQVMLHGEGTVYRGFRKKEKGMIYIDGLNAPYHLYNKVGFFTDHWSSEIEIPEDKSGVVVENDIVRGLIDEKTSIPHEGYVLVSNGKDIDEMLKKKDRIKINWVSTPNWAEVKESVSGGPYLIMGGEVYIDEKDQRFKFAIKDAYAPRSAIGIGKNGNLFLITVDGRRPGLSVGVTLTDFAGLLKKLELQEAINLDGGGSTTLVVDGKIVNTLSERHERKVSNALLVFYKD